MGGWADANQWVLSYSKRVASSSDVLLHSRMILLMYRILQKAASKRQLCDHPFALRIEVKKVLFYIWL
jgi:hypothetical protein